MIHVIRVGMLQYNTLILGLDNAFHLVKMLCACVGACQFSAELMKSLIDQLVEQMVALAIANAFRTQRLCELH